MAKVSKEKSFNKQLIISSIKSLTKILLLLVIAFFYLISVLFFVSPKTDAKIFNFFGLAKAEESCYEQVYKQSNSTADLYNLVLFEQQINNEKKELLYINELLKKEDYSDFCNKLNTSSIANAGNNKNLIIAVGDVDSYLNSRKVKCLYKINQSNAFENRSNAVGIFVRSNLATKNALDLSFSTYVSSVIADDDLSYAQIKKEFENFRDLWNAENQAQTSELLLNQENSIDEAIENAQTTLEKLFAVNSMIKFQQASYNYNKYLGADETTLTLIKTRYENAVAMFNGINL